MHCGVALLSLSLVSLSFYPADLPWLAFVGFIPWMFFHRRYRPRGTARALMLGYYVHFVYLFWWAGEVALPLAFLIPLMGLPWILVLAWVLDLAVHRARLPGVVAYPLGIVGLEVPRQMLYGASWCSLGYSAWRDLPLIQTATVFGVYLASFAILALSAAGAGLVELGLEGGAPWRGGRAGRATVRLVGLLLLGGAPYGGARIWGAHVLAQVATRPGPRVLGIQPAIPQGVKLRSSPLKNWRRCMDLTREALDQGPPPDLLVYPETSGLNVMEGDLLATLRRPLRGLSGQTPGAVLPRGATHLAVLGYLLRRPLKRDSRVLDENGDHLQEWNVAGVVAGGTRLVGVYAKRHLAPFGEFLPLPRWLPGRNRLKNMIREQAGYLPDLSPGTRPVVVAGPSSGGGSYRFGLGICYDLVFPQDFRELTREGAEFFVNISNDGWYHKSAELDLVHVAARFRAIECRRSLFRVSNTGISTLVGPDGRYLQVLMRKGRRKDVVGWLRGQVPLCAERTPYARLGLLPASLFPGLFLALLLSGLWWQGCRRRRECRGSRSKEAA